MIHIHKGDYLGGFVDVLCQLDIIYEVHTIERNGRVFNGYTTRDERRDDFSDILERVMDLQTDADKHPEKYPPKGKRRLIWHIGDGTAYPDFIVKEGEQ